MADIQKVRDVMMSNFTKVDGIMKVSDVLDMQNQRSTGGTQGWKRRLRHHDLKRYRQKSDWTTEKTS